MENPGHNLPDKLYFRIGEVSDIVGVKPYVLRYWETEFSDVKPTKSKSGQRLYKKKDVELLLMVKELLYRKRFTINGAKQRLKEVGKGVKNSQSEVPYQAVEAEVDVEVKVGEVRSSVDKKFLQKIKSDLEWCLSEIRAGD